MADNAPDMTRWQGFTHKELYRLLHEGAGPAASGDPSRRWAEIAGTLTEVGQDLRHAIDKSGAVWTGQAAAAAHQRLSGLVDWAQQTATGATQMRTSVENQADYLARARADMPVPEDMAAAAPDPAAVPVQQVIAAQRDSEPVEASSSTGAQRAFEVMAAYQRNTTTNTTAMAAFTAPAELLGDLDLTRHHRVGVVLNTPIVSIGIDTPAPPPSRHDQQQHGHRHHHFDWDGTAGAGFEGEPMRRPTFAPGSFTVAAPPNQPFLGPTIGWPGFGDDSGSGSGSGRSGSGSGRGGGTSVGPPSAGAPTSGAPTSGVPTSGGAHSGPGIGSAAGFGPHSADFQSAAAGQAAAAAGTPAAATPGAAAGPGSGTAGSSADPRALRRFGVEGTIGSGTWFGDSTDYEVRGATPTRRRHDLTQPDPVTESVSIDGEEHHLPHTVIGDGPH